MVLVYDDILKRVENFNDYKEVYAKDECKPLIENFNKENLQSVSYDVTIGKYIMKATDKIKVIHLDKAGDVDAGFVKVDISNGYQLRPNEYILAELNERLNMPDDLTGHIRPRTTFNKLGLIITSQHLNPSYTGNLQIGIKNMTPNAIEIVPNLIIGQVVFETLTGRVREEALYRNKKNAKYQNEKDFVKSKVYEETNIKRAEEIFNKVIKEIK